MTRKISSRSLSTQKIQILIKAPEWTLDTELTANVQGDLYISAIYTGPDGRLLTVLKDGAGRLYDSREAWLSQFESIEALRKQDPVHLLHGRLPQGQNFPNEVPNLLDELAVKLSILVEQLDKSKNSLKKVDQALRRKGRSKCLEAEIFAPLVAYVGEVIRQKVGGHWEMRANYYGDVWEPWLIDAQGRCIPIFSSVYDELYEEARCSISSVFEVWCD